MTNGSPKPPPDTSWLDAGQWVRRAQPRRPRHTCALPTRDMWASVPNVGAAGVTAPGATRVKFGNRPDGDPGDLWRCGCGRLWRVGRGYGDDPAAWRVASWWTRWRYWYRP